MTEPHSILELFLEISAEIFDGDAHLRHRVAFAHGDCSVFERVEVHRHAVRRAYLVLTAIALAYRPRAVEIAHEMLAKLGIYLLRLVRKLFLQWQHRDFNGSDGGMEMHHHAGVALAHFFLVVRVAKQREHHTLDAERRLDDVRHILLVGDGVGVGKVLAAGVDVLGEVVVRAVRDAPELSPAEGEEELEVRGGFGIEAQLFRAVVAQTEFLVVEAQTEQPFVAEFAPVGEPFEVCSGLQKNSSSICSNSRTRKIKLPGVISLRKDLPICPMPKGTRFLVVRCTFLKLTKMPCAVSGRR